MLKQCQEEALPKLQRQGELAPQLPHAVQEEEEHGGFLPEPGMRVGRVGAAEAEGVASLQRAPNGRRQPQEHVQLEAFLMTPETQQASQTLPASGKVSF